MDSLQLAQFYARTKHEGQSYGVLPYTHHLADVARWVKFFNGRENLVIAAWLHDVLEDTNTKYRDIYEAFGKEIADIVEAVTGRGVNRKERNADAYEKIRNAGEDATLLKLCDRLANVEHSGASLDMYKKEWPGFWRALRDDSHNENIINAWMWLGEHFKDGK